MLYSLFILTVGIYLGQEYPSIPSIKNIFLMYTKENKNVESEQQEFTYKPGYSDKLLSMLRKYVT